MTPGVHPVIVSDSSSRRPWRGGITLFLPQLLLQDQPRAETEAELRSLRSIEFFQFKILIMGKIHII